MNKKDSIKPFIIQTMIMRLSEKESLSYLQDKGFNIESAYYYRLKKQIIESRLDRLSLIAKHGFVDQHLERIDQLELVNLEYWKLYNETKDTFKKALILEKIAELQTYISPFYDASMYVMQKQVESNHETEKSSSLSVL